MLTNALVFPLLLLTACSPMATSTPALPALTPTLIPFTPTEPPPTQPPPTSTPLPPTLAGPPLPIDSILEEARHGCAGGWNAPWAGGFVSTPLVALKENEDGYSWDLASVGAADDRLIAADARLVKTLACIREQWYQEENFRYPDGEVAFRKLWDVLFDAWPERFVFGHVTLVGPHLQDKTGKGPGYGDAPLDAFRALLRNMSLSTTFFTGGAISAFSEDGLTLVTATSKSGILLWDLVHGRPLDINIYGPNSESPFAEYLAVSSKADKIAITGLPKRVTSVIETTNSNLLYAFGAAAPAFSPGGNYLAVADPVKENQVTFEIWLVDSSLGYLIGKLPDGHKDLIQSISFSADGRWLVSGGVDKKVIVWDVENRRLAYIHENSSPVESVAISPDGRLVAFTGSEGVQVWEVGTESILFSSPEYQTGHSVLAFSPDGRYLAFAGNENTSFLLDLNKKETSPLFHHASLIQTFFFSPDRSKLYIAETNGTILAIPYHN